MTLNELERKLVELDELRSELKSVIDEVKGVDEEKPEPPHPRRIPKESEFYYYIGDTGGIHIDRWNSDNIDEFRFSTGNVFPRANVFRTSAEAEFVLERLKVLAEMQEWAGDWDDKYTLVYLNILETVSFVDVPMYNYNYGEMRFATEKDAENCIKAVGIDRIKKYYFMIPEDKK